VSGRVEEKAPRWAFAACWCTAVITSAPTRSLSAPIAGPIRSGSPISSRCSFVTLAVNGRRCQAAFRLGQSAPRAWKHPAHSRGLGRVVGPPGVPVACYPNDRCRKDRPVAVFLIPGAALTAKRRPFGLTSLKQSSSELGIRKEPQPCAPLGFHTVLGINLMKHESRDSNGWLNGWLNWNGQPAVRTSPDDCD
jgi:hypothetical protein